ncbi:DUF1294 domain-containing protein [Sphingorhabdus soli]|uniref:DUF1294 domain-containing protein n=1 Tax=Flavisphingopyxis soli TaxID=2601267 RepID=A0A5C6U832_9SPHN|nr:DUF1294 domain-containing protein [Sphingorhabdus soli]TXC68994.1 DUF1294 domain-containing protein [Sphingorhabdus soli]
MLIAYWIIAANTVAFVLMVWDKSCARNGRSRIAESTLITWSALGGSIGALAAARIVRHKTRKQPIANILRAMPLVHGLILALWSAGYLDPIATAISDKIASETATFSSSYDEPHGDFAFDG